MGEFTMKIKQVSELTGVPASAIRYYESQGLLPPTKRTASGYRHYSQEDVFNIRLIKFNQNLGFQLSELKILAQPKENIDHSKLLDSLQTKQKDVAILIDELKLKQKQLNAIESIAVNYWNKGKCVPQEELENMLALDT